MTGGQGSEMGAPTGVFLHYLNNLSGLVERAQSVDCDGVLLQAKLAPGMFPLIQQVATAVGFSLRVLCPLSDKDTPELGAAANYSDLQALIQRALDFIHRIPGSAFDGFQCRRITTRAGFADREFTGADFLNLYGLPNFLFHYTMAYAILRSKGFPVGKADFDGFHEYPPGFSFTGQ